MSFFVWKIVISCCILLKIANIWSNMMYSFFNACCNPFDALHQSSESFSVAQCFSRYSTHWICHASHASLYVCVFFCCFLYQVLTPPNISACFWLTSCGSSFIQSLDFSFSQLSLMIPYDFSLCPLDMILQFHAQLRAFTGVYLY